MSLYLLFDMSDSYLCGLNRFQIDPHYHFRLMNEDKNVGENAYFFCKKRFPLNQPKAFQII